MVCAGGWLMRCEITLFSNFHSISESRKREKGKSAGILTAHVYCQASGWLQSSLRCAPLGRWHMRLTLRSSHLCQRTGVDGAGLAAWVCVLGAFRGLSLGCLAGLVPAGRVSWLPLGCSSVCVLGAFRGLSLGCLAGLVPAGRVSWLPLGCRSVCVLGAFRGLSLGCLAGLVPAGRVSWLPLGCSSVCVLDALRGFSLQGLFLGCLGCSSV